MSPFISLATPMDREEEMDAADLPDARYARVLRGLARVNAVTLARRPTLAFFARIIAARGQTPSAPIRLLDVGFGHGDMLRAIARMAAQRGVAVDLVGIDLNPRSEAAARAATPAGMPIRWITGDYADLAGQGWDGVTSSLVTHHMTIDQRIAFLHFMERESRIGWFVNDLHRLRLPYMGYPLLALLLGVDPIVRRDGQTSIARSFRTEEWQAMLATAGIDGAQVQRYFPARLCVERIK